MDQKEQSILSNKKEFSLDSISVFSEGKKKSAENEDAYVLTPSRVAVIDGVTSKSQRTFDGRSGGAFGGKLVAEILKDCPPELFGKKLVDEITLRVNEVYSKLNLGSDPNDRPSALFTTATFDGEDLVVTQMSDVSFRVNGKDIYTYPKEIDEINAKKRQEAIKNILLENPNIEIDDLLKRGREAIMPSLKEQASLQNNEAADLGFGVIDGQNVPDKFVKVFRFPLKEVSVLEIFSDGYFKVAEEPTIESWEEAFREVEEKDPYKIGEYKSTKGSTSDSFTDDRTVMIIKFK